MTDVKDAVRLLTDEAERLGAEANDEQHVVRSLVLAHGLGFNAWFCVCCELAERSAKQNGFASECDRAYTVAKRNAAARRQLN